VTESCTTYLYHCDCTGPNGTNFVLHKQHCSSMELLGEKNPSSSMMELNDGTTGIKRIIRQHAATQEWTTQAQIRIRTQAMVAVRSRSYKYVDILPDAIGCRGIRSDPFRADAMRAVWWK
jgi:hypothetical protein